MAKRPPYTFPHRSRKAMTAYILQRQGYCDHFTPFAFSWNVKAYSVNWENPEGESKLDPALTAAWKKELDHAETYAAITESAQNNYVSDWTSWPGDDQGEWQFGFYGRSGGHLCLEEWRKTKLYGRDFDPAEWLAELTTAELRKFYIGIRCADSDFTNAKASQEMEYHANFARGNWEERVSEELKSLESDITSARKTILSLTKELKDLRKHGAALPGAICATVRAAISEHVATIHKSRRFRVGIIAGEIRP